MERLVIKIDAFAAVAKTIKDLLQKQGYDVKVMEGANLPIDLYLDTLEVLRDIPLNYPKDIEIIIIPVD